MVASKCRMCQLLVLIHCEDELRLHRKALGRVGYLTGVRIQGMVLVCSLPEAKASIRGRQRALGLCGPLLSPDGPFWREFFLGARCHL